VKERIHVFESTAAVIVDDEDLSLFIKQLFVIYLMKCLFILEVIILVIFGSKVGPDNTNKNGQQC